MAATQSPLQLRYQVVEGWEQLPAGWTHQDCVGVSVDAQDNVYQLTREQPRLIVYRRDGAFLRSWGEDLFTERTHGVAVAADGRVFVADRENDRIQIFTADGQFVTQWTDVQRPTNVALDREGRVYVSELWWRVGQRSQVHGDVAEDQPGRVSVFDPE